MGYIRHDTMIATVPDRVDLDTGRLRDRIREAAGDRFVNLLAGPTWSTTNGYKTLFLAPDGSKEGWDDSEMGDVVRLVFADHVLEAYPDADIVQVSYGGDYGVECGPKVAEVEGSPAVLRLAPSEVVQLEAALDGPPVPNPGVVDLVAALRASVEAAKARREAGGR